MADILIWAVMSFLLVFPASCALNSPILPQVESVNITTVPTDDPSNYEWSVNNSISTNDLADSSVFPQFELKNETNKLNNTIESFGLILNNCQKGFSSWSDPKIRGFILFIVVIVILAISSYMWLKFCDPDGELDINEGATQLQMSTIQSEPMSQISCKSTNGSTYGHPNSLPPSYEEACAGANLTSAL